MAENRNIHWTDDDELLSKYVLDQLDAGERTSLSAHLNACKRCSEAVRNERQIAAGAKLAGRSSLKERLDARLAINAKKTTAAFHQTNARQIPWTRVAGVAAVFLILITVGVYNNWFDANTWKKPPATEQVVPEQPQQLAETRAKEEKDATEKAEPTIAAKVPERYGIDNSRTRQQEQTMEKKTVGKSDDTFARTLPSSPNTIAGGRIDAVGEQAAGNELGLADQTLNASQETFWVEGRVLSDSRREQVEAQLLSRAEKQPSDQALSGMKKSAASSQELNVDEYTPNITLRQRLSSSLPSSQQRRQYESQAIQTLIENRMDGMQLTVFLDSLVPDSDFRNSTVVAVGEDSLVLNLPNQQIGYRLSPALRRQVNTKTKR